MSVRTSYTVDKFQVSKLSEVKGIKVSPKVLGIILKALKWDRHSYKYKDAESLTQIMAGRIRSIPGDDLEHLVFHKAKLIEVERVKAKLCLTFTLLGKTGEIILTLTTTPVSTQTSRPVYNYAHTLKSR